MNSSGHATSVCLVCVALSFLIAGCSGKTIDDPLLNAWSQKAESIGSQYTVELVQKTGQLAHSVGEDGDTEVIEVKCIRQGTYRAIEVTEPNGDQYVRLKNPEYCAVLSRPSSEDGYKIDLLAPFGTNDYQSESLSVLKLDPISSLMTGEFLVDFYKAAGLPNVTQEPGDTRYRYNVGIDDDAIKNIEEANLDKRLIPREFQVEVISSAISNNSDRWLGAWEWKPVTFVDGQILELPRRRVTVEEWTKFADLTMEIPSSFDFWTDESGEMIRYRNRQITSYSSQVPNESSVFFLRGYGLPEVPLRGRNWNLFWALAGILVVGVVGYLFLPRLFQNR